LKGNRTAHPLPLFSLLSQSVSQEVIGLPLRILPRAGYLQLML
jgi:hypothetical protein